MFGLFRKKKSNTALDQFILTVYGSPPPAKRADLEKATALAVSELLLGVVDESHVRHQVNILSSGPIPYSTQDLALSVAMHFFKQPELVLSLDKAQLTARLHALQWLQNGQAAPLMVQAFEHTLYTIYKPQQ